MHNAPIKSIIKVNKPVKAMPKIKAKSLQVGDIVLDPNDGMPLMVVFHLEDAVIAFNAIAQWAIQRDTMVYFLSRNEADQLQFLDNTKTAAQFTLQHIEDVCVALNLNV